MYVVNSAASSTSVVDGISVAYVGAKKKTTTLAAKKSRPTAADIAAAQRLKAIWDNTPDDRRPSQQEIGLEFQPRISQPAVHQYLNGIIPLNFTAVVIFASQLGCRTEDIRDDLPEFDLLRRVGWRSTDKPPQAERAHSPPPLAGWPFGALLLARYEALSTEQKEQMREVLGGAMKLAVSGHDPPAEKKSDRS